MSDVRVAVIGAGYWGPNLIRNFSACPGARLVAVCDRDPGRLKKALAGTSATKGYQSTEDLLSNDSIDAVVIATPVSTHAPLALAAIAAGKHVLVEKPLAANAADAAEMVAAAREARKVLMVDHTFLFSSPVQKMKQLVNAGDLGQLHFVDSVRINLGLFQHDINVVWDLAPHDLSIMDYLVSKMPRSLSAFGACHTQGSEGIEDVAYLNLDFGANLLASFHVNWLSPVKIRHFIVGGAEKSIVFDDLHPSEKIRIYDRGISVAESIESRRGVLISYRTGDVWCPHLSAAEPLQEMARHFVHCINTGDTPISDGESGLRIVRILEAAQCSIKAQGGRITL